MIPPDRPAPPGSDPASAGGPAASRLPEGAHLPEDLGPDEQDLAGWFSRLERPQPGTTLPARVRAALVPGDPAPTPAEPDEVRRMWGWWTAAAAVVLLALGVNAMRGDSPEPIRERAVPGGAAPLALTRPAPERSLWVMNDPNLALFHDLETFDALGLEPTDVLALGDR